MLESEAYTCKIHCKRRACSAHVHCVDSEIFSKNICIQGMAEVT